jgi:Rieske Fe-S protein
VYGHTHADSIQSDGTSARVTTRTGATITAGSVVVTTNTPVNDKVVIHTKQSPWRTYIVGLRVPSGSVPHGLYWDTEDPYHYVRLQTVEDHDVLIVGGEDHKTGHANDPDRRYANLERWTRERFPMAREVEFYWSGQVMEPFDCLSFTGRNPGDAPNVYIHTGDSGMGLTHGTLGAILLTDLIVGRPNPWAKLYDPSRVNPKGLGTWAKDNLVVAAQYADLLTPGDVAGVSEIAPRTGAVVRRGATKVAIYRDENDKLHECSAICPHMGCVVKWNHGESTWDCPCHGSRFDAYGRVVNGPANEDLRRIEAAVPSERRATTTTEQTA